MRTDPNSQLGRLQDQLRAALLTKFAEQLRNGVDEDDIAARCGRASVWVRGKLGGTLQLDLRDAALIADAMEVGLEFELDARAQQTLPLGD
ncbi:MAG: hypothetical protein AB7I59_30600 [Geminicoccaceae bacterium]